MSELELTEEITHYDRSSTCKGKLSISKNKDKTETESQMLTDHHDKST